MPPLWLNKRNTPQGPSRKIKRRDTITSSNIDSRLALVLAGWEVKSLRASKLQLVDSYVLLKDGEAWLLGSHITPLTTASTHVIADPVRTRKLLLNAPRTGKARRGRAAKRLRLRLLVLVLEQALVKCEIALGKGKKEYDKRDTERERDSNRELHRAVRNKGKEE